MPLPAGGGSSPTSRIADWFDGIIRGAQGRRVDALVAEMRRFSQRMEKQQTFEPTFRRLRVLLDAPLRDHTLPGVFLTGSMSWGRFHAVSDCTDHVSDIDLLVVVPSWKDITTWDFVGLVAPDVLRGMDVLLASMPTDLELHSLVIAGEAAGCNFDVSLTFMTQESFAAIVKGELWATLNWRRQWGGSMENTLYNFRGEPVRVPISQEPRAHGTIVRIGEWPLDAPAWFPSGYQQLLLPCCEYIGRCDSTLIESVRSLMDYTAERWAAAGAGQLLWHKRAAAMPSRLTDHGMEVLREGPVRVL